MLGGRPATRIGLALLGAWLGLAASLYCSVEFWFVAWATVVTYIAYFLGDITRLGGAGRLGMIAFFVGAYQVFLPLFPLFCGSVHVMCHLQRRIEELRDTALARQI